MARHTLGWDALRERALEWPPERVAEVCGLDARAGADLARDYGACAMRGEPAAIRLNYGMQRVRGGGNAVRADRLPAGADRRLAASRRWRAAVVPATFRCSAPRWSARICAPAKRHAPST
jgi:hypothetical protein